ncbi:MAG: alpha/beta hydrolase [Archangium sp.]
MKRWSRRLALVLLAVIAIIVVRGWAPDIAVDELSAKWAPPPSQFIELDGLRVHYRDVGPRDDPTPLVLMHGTSASLHTWEGWVAELSKRHRVVTFDLPGFGLTGGYPDGDASVTHSLHTLTALFDALHLQHIVLVGNSYGGRIAWEFALAHPERLHRLVLVDASGYPRESTSVPLGFRMLAWPGISLIRDYILPRSVVERSVRSVYGDPSKVTDALVDRYYALQRREGNRRALVQRMEQVPLVGDVARLKSLQVKTLILWGAKDGLIPPDSAKRFDEDIPDSTLVMFDALGHVPHEEDAPSTARALEAFLDETR